MIWIIVIISVVMLVVGSNMANNSTCCSAKENVGITMAILGAIVSVVSIIVAIVFIVLVTNSSTIDDRIAMYQEENINIENQVATIVEEYKTYENDTFDKLTPESAITYAIVYPELKSNDLVNSQIEIYVQNNEKIKALRESKICAGVYKWWLYFGK